MIAHLKVEWIDYGEGCLYCRRLKGPEIALNESCTFGGVRLRVDAVALRLSARASVALSQQILALVNKSDTRMFEEGQVYELSDGEGC
jgi:hypothetical protein